MKTAIPAFLWALALAGQQPSANFQISANGGRSIELPQGWPLIVKGVILPPLGMASDPAPLRLTPEGIAWFDSIRFQATSAEGGGQGWELKLATLPSQPDLTLQRGQYAVLEWTMSGELTANLMEGTYSLAAAIDIQTGDGWRGRISAVPIEIRVVPKPSQLTSQQEADLARLRVREALHGGRAKEAEEHVDALLQNQPSSIFGLQAKAALMESRGSASLALLPALLALDAFRKQYPNAPEPPDDLYALVDRLRSAASAQSSNP